jgi:hypothetical protein
MRVVSCVELKISIQGLIYRFRNQLSSMVIDPGRAITHRSLREQAVIANLSHLIGEWQACLQQAEFNDDMACSLLDTQLKDQWQGTYGSLLFPFNDPNALAYQFFFALSEILRLDQLGLDHWAACFNGQDWGLRWHLQVNWVVNSNLASIDPNFFSLTLEKKPFHASDLQKSRWQAQAYLTDGQYVLDYVAFIDMLEDNLVASLAQTGLKQKKQQQFVRKSLIQFFNQLQAQYPDLYQSLLLRNPELPHLAQLVQSRPILRDVLIELKGRLFAGGKVVQGDPSNAGRVAYLAIAEFTEIVSQLTEVSRRMLLELPVGANNKNLGQIIQFLDDGGCVEVAAENIQALVNNPVNSARLSRELVLQEKSEQKASSAITVESLRAVKGVDKSHITHLSAWVMGQWLTLVETQQAQPLSMDAIVEICACLDEEGLEYFISYYLARRAVQRDLPRQPTDFVSPTSPLHGLMLSSLVQLPRRLYLVILRVFFDPSYRLPVVRNMQDLYLALRVLNAEQINDLMEHINFAGLNMDGFALNWFVGLSQYLPENWREKFYEIHGHKINDLMQDLYNNPYLFRCYLEIIPYLSLKHVESFTEQHKEEMRRLVYAKGGEKMLWSTLFRLPAQVQDVFIKSFNWDLIYKYLPKSSGVDLRIDELLHKVYESMIHHDWPTLNLSLRAEVYNKIPTEYAKAHFARDHELGIIKFSCLKEKIRFIAYMNKDQANKLIQDNVDMVREYLVNQYEEGPDGLSNLILLFRWILSSLSGSVKEGFFDYFVKSFMIEIKNEHDYYSLIHDLEIKYLKVILGAIKNGENYLGLIGSRKLSLKQQINTLINTFSAEGRELNQVVKIFLREIIFEFSRKYFSYDKFILRKILKNLCEELRINQYALVTNFDELVHMSSWLRDDEIVFDLIANKINMIDSSTKLEKLISCLDRRYQSRVLSHLKDELADLITTPALIDMRDRAQALDRVSSFVSLGQDLWHALPQDDENNQSDNASSDEEFLNIKF